MIINMNGAKAPETPSSVLQEKTVTPETLPTVIGADEGYDGLSQVTVNPDAQLKAENIRSGKTIFGVAGAFTGEKQVDATAVYEANKIGYSIPAFTTIPAISGLSWSASSKPSSELSGRPSLPQGNYMTMSGNVAWLNQFVSIGGTKYSYIFETQAPEKHYTNTIILQLPSELQSKSVNTKITLMLIRALKNNQSASIIDGESIQADDVYECTYEFSGNTSTSISIPIDFTFPAKTMYYTHYNSTAPEIKYELVWVGIERIMIEVLE